MLNLKHKAEFVVSHPRGATQCTNNAPIRVKFGKKECISVTTAYQISPGSVETWNLAQTAFIFVSVPLGGATTVC